MGGSSRKKGRGDLTTTKGVQENHVTNQDGNDCAKKKKVFTHGGEKNKHPVTPWEES